MTSIDDFLNSEDAHIVEPITEGGDETDAEALLRMSKKIEEIYARRGGCFTNCSGYCSCGLDETLRGLSEFLEGE